MMEYYSHDSPDRYASDSYRRQSPSTAFSDRRSRARSRSPQSIDRYQPTDRPRDRERDRDRDYGRDSGRGRDRDRERGRDRDRDREGNHKTRDEGSRRISPGGSSNIDRYIPGQEPSVPAPTSNPMPSPHTMDSPAGFTYFAEWWRLEQQILDEKERQKYGTVRQERVREREDRGKERVLIQAAYDAYKAKFQTLIVRNFIQQHKTDEWFRERYDPDMRKGFDQGLSTVRKDAYMRWIDELDSGAFDSFTLEGVSKHEYIANQMAGEREEGEMNGNDVLGVSDLLVSPGSDLRDPALAEPTLLIKTIAPTVSRERLEQFCREYLSEEDGGFKWLSLSDPNPLKKYHRIGWVILKSKSPSADELETAEDGEAFESTDFVKKALGSLNGKTVFDPVRGDFTCHVGIHEPPVSPRRKALWDLLSAPERIERDLDLASRLVTKLDTSLGPDYGGLSSIETKVESLRAAGALRPHGKSAKREASNEPGDQSMDEGEEEEEGACEDDEEDEDMVAQKKKLDLLVEYLRRVFNFCFYCVFESDSVHELTRKCPGGHLRRPRSVLTSVARVVAKATVTGESFPLAKSDPGAATAGEEAESASGDRVLAYAKPGSKVQLQLQRAFNWVKSYESKILQIIEPENADVRKLGGRPVDEAIDEDLAKHVKQEDEAKFRCKLGDCTKLFKAYHFWKKHVEKRHLEFYETVRREVETTNAYVLDPGHLPPPYVRSDLMGSHPHLGQQTGFSPRSGTSVGPLGPNMNMAMFNNFGMNQNGGHKDNRPGPVRSRNFTNRQINNGRPTGPYVRPEVDRRVVTRNSPGRERRTDAIPVGPRETVQGRSLKSYEDLDAAGAGTGADALDY